MKSASSKGSGVSVPPTFENTPTSPTLRLQSPPPTPTPQTLPSPTQPPHSPPPIAAMPLALAASTAASAPLDKGKGDENQIREAFINEGRGHSPTHLKFFLLVFSKLKEDIK